MSQHITLEIRNRLLKVKTLKAHIKELEKDRLAIAEKRGNLWEQHKANVDEQGKSQQELDELTKSIETLHSVNDL